MPTFAKQLQAQLSRLSSIDEEKLAEFDISSDIEDCIDSLENAIDATLEAIQDAEKEAADAEDEDE